MAIKEPDAREGWRAAPSGEQGGQHLCLHVTNAALGHLRGVAPARDTGTEQTELTGHLRGVAPARDTGTDSIHEDTSHGSRLRAFHKWPHGNIWKHQG